MGFLNGNALEILDRLSSTSYKLSQIPGPDSISIAHTRSVLSLLPTL